MAKIEIEEGDLLAKNNVVQAMQELLGNAQARDLVLRARKIVKPDAVIPELDARAPVEAALAQVNETLAKLQKDRADEIAANEAEKKTRKFAQAWDDQKAGLRAQGYTDEGIARIEEHAAKEGIPSLRAAAADFDRLNPPATVSATTSYDVLSYVQSPPADDEPMKALMESKGEDNGALNTLIRNALTESRSAAPRR